MDRLTIAISSLHREAAGVLEVNVIRGSDLPTLSLAALQGEERSVRTIRLLGKFLDRIDYSTRRAAVQCAACDRALKHHHFACVIVRPFRDDAAEALCFGICGHCVPSKSPAAVKAKAIDVLNCLWPGGRILDGAQTHVAGGHA